MKLSNRMTPVNFWPVDLEGFLDQFVAEPLKNNSKCGFTPRTNIEETEKGFVLEMELPGIDAEAVNVEVADGRLTVSSEKEACDASQEKNYHRVERTCGSFSRSFEFPTQVDFEKIEASSVNGVLTIHLPKSEKVLPRKIEIKSS